MTDLPASFLSLILQKVPTSNTEGGWSFSLAEYIRHNDMPIYEASERVLRAFQDELMPAESLSEIFDVAGQYAYTADPLNKVHRFHTPSLEFTLNVGNGRGVR